MCRDVGHPTAFTNIGYGMQGMKGMPVLLIRTGRSVLFNRCITRRFIHRRYSWSACDVKLCGIDT